MLICWDQWFPEAARLVAMQGAELIVAPTAIAWIESEGAAEHARQLDAWRTVQRGHAIANGVYWAAVNRAGTEEGLRFWGRSFLAGPLGELLCEAGEGPETLIGCCSRELLAETRRVWPFWRDRRPELYGGLLKRFGK